MALKTSQKHPSGGSLLAAIERKRSRPYVPRDNHGGNYCGHSPESPQLALSKDVVSPGKSLPGILTELLERVKRYYSKPDVIPSLRNANRSAKGRQQRSERREACLQLLAAIISYTDLVSLRCGVPTKQGFMSLTLNYLVEFTGLHMRRAERAMADLKRANLITCSQPRQLKEDGTYRGLAAVKAVNKLLFTVFALDERLIHEKRRAVERLAMKAKKSGVKMTSWARNMLVVGGTKSKVPKPIQKPGPEPGPDLANGAPLQIAMRGLGSLYRSPQQPPKWAPSGSEGLTASLARQLLAIKILTANPGWTAVEVNAEADRIIKLGSAS